MPKSCSIPLTKYIGTHRLCAQRIAHIHVTGSAFLQNLESEMKSFASAVTEYKLVAKHESELYTIRVSSATSLVLTFKDSYHRLLFHGICTYFRLSSVSTHRFSVVCPECDSPSLGRWSESGERLTVVRRPRSMAPLPEESIEQYLLRRQKRH